MTTSADCSVGLKKETTYGTAVTVDRHLEFLDADFSYDPEYVAGEGLRVGSRVQRGSRRAVGSSSCSGTLNLEANTRGLGVIFEAAFGAATSTLITGSAYQQVFTPATTDPLPSYTVQIGTPPVGGGATVAETFLGAQCESIELSCAVGEVLKLATEWIAREVQTAIAYAAPSYPVNGEPYTFRHGSIVMGGTLVPPTTTVLGSLTAGTVVGNITAWSVKYANGLDNGGFTFGSAGMRGRKAALGRAEIGGSLTAEFDSVTLRDAYLNQTDLKLILTFQTSTIISGSNKPTIQIVIPLMRLTGELPKPNGGDVITQTCPFVVLDDTVNAPIYVVVVTADTAI